VTVSARQRRDTTVRRRTESCGRAFLQAEIKLINPAVVVGLGERAFSAVLRAFQLPLPRFSEAVRAAKGTNLPTGAVALAVYHCGARNLNTLRPEADQMRDWQRVGAMLEAQRQRGA